MIGVFSKVLIGDNFKKSVLISKGLQQNLSVKDIFKVFRAHIISKLTYCSLAWCCNLLYLLKARLKSFYFHLIRVLIKDFDYKLNRPKIIEKLGLESLDTILFKRMSVFIFNLIRNLYPTRLACEFIIRLYVNERYPDRLTLFDLSLLRIGKKSISNHAKNVVDKWNFDWLNISSNSFKSKIRAQFI